MKIFARCEFGGVSYSTDQVPSAKISVSPRVGIQLGYYR